MSSSRPSSAAIRKAQQIRMQRMSWGFGNQLCAIVIVLALYLFGLVPGLPVIVYLITLLVIDAIFITLIKSNLNLRFGDPSMTAAQILVPIWPAIYIMFFVEDLQARVAFLLLAASGLLFGMFALSRRGMLGVGGVILLAYLLLLVALSLWAPDRIHWQVEFVIVFAYSSVLMIVAYLGSYIASIRQALREQNLSLAQLAKRDPLTNLPNRRSILEYLDKEKSRAERREQDNNVLCVCMLDIDYFKRINDKWGHHAGDAVLVRIGEALEQVMRKGDIFGRFGGEEFVVVLPETTREAAHIASERVRKSIASLTFPELPEGEKISVSQGVAVHRSGDEIDVTLRRADKALYEAKSKGRNRVVIAPD